MSSGDLKKKASELMQNNVSPGEIKKTAGELIPNNMSSGEMKKTAGEVMSQARPLVEEVEKNLVHQLRSYASPAATVIAALGFFMSGQARLRSLSTGRTEKMQKGKDNSDDGLIPLLSRLGVRFSSSNATKIIGLIKMALSIGLLYKPTRRPAARYGLAYTLLGLFTRLHEGITLTPALLNMALLSLPAELISL